MRDRINKRSQDSILLSQFESANAKDKTSKPPKYRKQEIEDYQFITEQSLTLNRAEAQLERLKQKSALFQKPKVVLNLLEGVKPQLTTKKNHEEKHRGLTKTEEQIIQAYKSSNEGKYTVARRLQMIEG